MEKFGIKTRKRKHLQRTGGLNASGGVGSQEVCTECEAFPPERTVGKRSAEKNGNSKSKNVKE